MRSALVTAGSAIAEKSADTGGCMWFLFLVFPYGVMGDYSVGFEAWCPRH